jgi:hypothetical protein
MKLALMSVLLLGACAVHTPACRDYEVEGCDPAKSWTCECNSRAGGGNDGNILGGGSGVDTPDDPDTDEPGGNGSGSSGDGDDGGDSGSGDDGGSDDSGPDDGSVKGDHDKGHGNDPDGHDEDNPGKGHGHGKNK